MSFPPNLGITNSFIIDSNISILFQELPSLLPPLDQIPSPFSISKMNGYSRITKKSKSLDFADLYSPRPKRIATTKNSIAEHEIEEGPGEVFGHILGRKCCVSNGTEMAVEKNSLVHQKRSFSIKRSVSMSDGYSRIHHESDLAVEDDDQCGSGFTTKKRGGKKKGKFFGAFRRLFGL